MQCGWASLLCLSGQYGNLLDYIVFTVLIFYILTIGGIFRLRKDKPLIPRPYKAFGYPFIPILYILLAAFICIVLLITQPIYSGLGLLIVLTGIPLYYLSSEKSK
jgi:APA family basic amino acid/polyamine antiporter